LRFKPYSIPGLTLLGKGGGKPPHSKVGWLRIGGEATRSFGGEGESNSVGPVFFLAGHTGSSFDEAGFTHAGAVFQGEIDAAAGVDVRAAFTALVFSRFYHFG
jgi:hypothetical protein